MLWRCAERRRCRPLLGTLVEVAVAAADPVPLDDMIAAAFEEIDRVHQKMSFHAAGSDVSRLNRSAWREAVAVDAWTYEVLSLAREIHELSGGVFEIATAQALARLGALPGEGIMPHACGTTADIELLEGHRVRFRRPLAIDLGGIAKGYAVDRAIEMLRAQGATSARVNAGGDLRIHGGPEWISVRHPACPALSIPLFELADGAVATTAGYFSPDAQAQVVDPRTGVLAPSQASVTVRASRCALADALTKVVWLLGEDAARILAVFDARSWVLRHEDLSCSPTAFA
jgi:thiamine biosynthesis lipoprotein